MIFLCRSADLTEGTAMGISLGSGLARREILLVRKERLLAYVNSCPHEGTPLGPLAVIEENGEIRLA
ncbi:MAG TPA: Rieske 2Fe-2S domain-containing protein [Rhizomicrobium sp.]|nr:Rieske 2Fe-2S domain-containing protein [Rhizomicrobium sp.]